MLINVNVEVDDDIYCDYCKYLDENTGDRIVLHCNLFHADVYADMGAAYKCSQCLNAPRVDSKHQQLFPKRKQFNRKGGQS